MREELVEWLAGVDTGLSSRAILAWMERVTVLGVNGRRQGMHHPLDPSDLGRCIRLMDIEPSYRDRIGEMAQFGPEWAALAAHWQELEALYREEVPEHRGVAPRTYARMKELMQGVQPRNQRRAHHE